MLTGPALEAWRAAQVLDDGAYQYKMAANWVEHSVNTADTSLTVIPAWTKGVVIAVGE